MQQAAESGEMTEAQQARMQQMMKQFGGGLPQIPGLKPGADPY